MDLYFFAILPNMELQERVQQIKLDLKEKYGVKHALKLPAHITLQPPFRMDCGLEKDLFEELDEFTQNQEFLKVQLSGFGAFPPRVIFIPVVHHESLSELRKQFLKILYRHIPPEEKGINPNFHPHITLATRDLLPETFKPAWLELRSKEFSASFLAEGFSLLKHNGKNWDLYRQFPFHKTG
ncbi:2'-5' RNA ligase family protein [Salinimicrobium flavum]|uniref:2'-5' RNA ligase family protein n=1 Tax=Salinimicrobium flavum TaxID=1737065 RepID=A0ABW5IYH1_9FLAO